MDTGAEASLIPVMYYERKLKQKIGPLDGNGNRVKVVGVTGNVVPIMGYIRAPITVADRTAEVGFLIVKDGTCTNRRSDFPVILGCNALRAILQEGSLPTKDGWSLVRETLQVLKKDVKKAVTSALTTRGDEVMPPLTVRRVECNTTR